MGVAPLSPARALRLHHESYVFDGHNDVALRLFEGEDIGARRAGGHLDLPRMRAGGFDGGVFAVWIDPDLPEPLARSLQGIETLRRYLDGHPAFRVVLRSADLPDAAAAGEIGCVIGVEGGYGITDDLDALDRLFDAGMRCLTLTWMAPTAWADAAGPPPVHDGLSGFGAAVVDRLQELGVAIDVSHASDEVVRQVLERTDVPVAASHSGMRAVANHHRNLPDDLLERISAAEGIVGVNFFSAYLDEEFERRYAPLHARYRDGSIPDLASLAAAVAATVPPLPLERLVGHVEHAVRVAGPTHVGLGSDFDGVAALPAGIGGANDLPALTLALAARGFDEATLTAFLGANWRRFFERVLG